MKKIRIIVYEQKDDIYRVIRTEVFLSKNKQETAHKIQMTQEAHPNNIVITEEITDNIKQKG